LKITAAVVTGAFINCPEVKKWHEEYAWFFSTLAVNRK
jgi:hypothetical protein